jgi:hypothetical protein
LEILRNMRQNLELKKCLLVIPRIVDLFKEFWNKRIAIVGITTITCNIEDMGLKKLLY